MTLKKYFLLGLLLVLTAGMCGANDKFPQVKAGDRILFVGDSLAAKNYPAATEMYLLYSSGIPDLKISSRGNFTTPDMAMGVLESELLPFRPTLVFLLFGYQQFQRTPWNSAKAAGFGGSLSELAKKFVAAGSRVVIVTPPPAGERKDLSEPSAAIKKIAEDAGVCCLDFNTAYREFHKKCQASGKPFINPSGSDGTLFFLYTLLKKLGVSGKIAEITIDFGTNTLEVSDGHKILKNQPGAAQIESRRYSFCWSMWSKPPVFDIIPFQSELNRFMLKGVHLDDDAKYRIEWGISRRTWTGRELKQGVNLSECGFANGNPFFMKNVEGANMISRKNRFMQTVLDCGIRSAQYFKQNWPDNPALAAAGRRAGEALIAGQDNPYRRMGGESAPVQFRMLYRAEP